MIKRGAESSPEGTSPFVCGENIIASVRANPAGASNFLVSAEGAALLRARLQAATTTQARVELLMGVREALGPENFSKIVAAYDQHKGIPLAADLLNISQPSPAAQRELLERCFGRGVTLFTPSERESFTTYLNRAHALTLETISLERERLTGQICATEGARKREIDSFIKVLFGDPRSPDAQRILGARPEDQGRLVLEAVHKRFPSLEGKNWNETITGLGRMANEQTPSAPEPQTLSRPEFRVVSTIQCHSPTSGSTSAPNLTGFFDRERHPSIGRESVSPDSLLAAVRSRSSNEIPGPANVTLSPEERKDLASRLNSHLQTIGGHDDSLVRLRQLRANGETDDVTKISESFDRLTEGLFAEYGSERIAATRSEARLYLETLPWRISNAQGEERERLVAERDSIEWRAVSTRVQLLLAGNPVNAEHSSRALELLNDFQRVGAGSPIARGADFVVAARHLTHSIERVDEYVREVEGMLNAQLTERSEEAGRLRTQMEQAETQLRAQTARDASDYWNELYKEMGTLQAILKIQGDTGVQARLREIEDEIAGAWFVNRTGGTLHREQVIALARAMEISRLDFARAQRDVHTLTARLSEEVSPESLGALRHSLLNTLFNPSQASIPGGDPTAIGLTLMQCGQRVTSIKRLSQLFGAITSSRSQSLSLLVDPPRALVPSLSPAAVSPDVSSTIGTARGPSANVSLVSTIHSLIIDDFTDKPSKAALLELRKTVPPDSEIGRQLRALGDPSESEIEQFTQRLYARVGTEDQMRVRLFLVSYDRPDIFRFVPDERLRDVPLSNPTELWSFLSSLGQDNERDELLPLLRVIPNLRQHQVIENTLSTLTEEQIARFSDDFKRITGASLGQRLVAMAPSGGALREKYLVEVVGPSRLVSQSDIAQFFGSERVPASLQERAAALNQLLLSDYDRQFSVTPQLEELVKSQAEERAALQVALDSMIQLRRDNQVDFIRARLAELDAAFEAEVSNCLRSYPAAYIARQGARGRIDEVRALGTHAAQIEIGDPYGIVSQAALQTLQAIENRSTPTDVVLAQIREGNYSPAQMLLFEMFYAQHVGHRNGGTTLTGDLRRDIAQRGGGGQPTPNQVELLLQGGQGLTQYDLALLSEGIRSNNPHLTVRAMIALKSKGLLEQAIRDLPPEVAKTFAAIQESPAGKEVATYYQAVKNSDVVQTGIIEIRHGIAVGAHHTSAFAGKVAEYASSLTGEQLERARALYREAYGADIVEHLNEGVVALRGRWDGILSSDPYKRATSIAEAAISSAGADLRLLQHAITPNITPEQRAAILERLNSVVAGFPDSFKYSDGKGPSVLLYLQSLSGPTARADADLLRRLLTPSEGTEALSPQALRRYIMQRERLVFQLQQVDELLRAREEINGQSRDFLNTVRQMHREASNDYDRRWTGRGLANDVVQVHRKMLNQQQDLMSLQNMGIADIRDTRELMRRRGELMLRDQLEGQDRGLTLEQNDHENRQLRARDAARQEIWVVARRDQVETWIRDAEIARERLANHDWWVDVGHTVLKTVVIVGVSFIPGVGPLGAFALATAWNFGDKFYKVVVNGMAIEEALRQFAIEFALDGAFFLIGGQALGRLVAKGGAYGSTLLKPLKGWGFTSQWLGRVPRVANPIVHAGKPAEKGFAGVLQKFGERWIAGANKNVADVALDGAKWAEVSWRKVIDGRWFGLGDLFSPQVSSFLKPAAPTPTDPRLGEPVSTANGSGWTPSILGPTFLDDLFGGAGKKDRKPSSSPSSPPPGSPPPIIPAAEVPVNAGDKPKPGDAPGAGGPALDPGSGGPNTYVLASLREAQEKVNSATNSVIAELQDAREAVRELQSTHDNLLASLRAEQNVETEQQRQHYIEQREALEARIQRLEETQRDLREEVGKLEAQEQQAFITGSQLPLDFEETRTQAQAAIEEIKQEIAQLRENLEGLKDSLATAEKQAQEFAQARMEAEAKREAAQQALQNALAEGQKLWNQTQEAVAVAQDGLRNAAAQAQATLIGALDTLATGIADAQARQQDAQAAALAAAQAQADADARARAEAQADALRQRASDAWNLVQQTAQDLTTKVQDIKDAATQKVTEVQTLVLNLVENVAQKAEEAGQAQAEAKRQEDALRAQQTYDAIRTGLSQAGESANAFLHELAKMSAREEQAPPKPLSEALLATLPPEIRANLEKVPGILSENLIQAREKIEGVVNEFQRVQREQQEQIANAQREEFRERIDKMLLEGKQLGQQAYEVIKEAVSELAARKEEQEALAREARKTLGVVSAEILNVGREIRALLDEVSRPTAALREERPLVGVAGDSPRDEDRRPIEQRVEKVLIRLQEEVARLALPERVAETLHPEMKSEWNRTRQVAEMNIATLRESIVVAEHARGPKTGESSPELSTARRAEIKEALERSLLVSEQACERTQRSIAREEARQVEEHSRSRQAIAELVTFARGSHATIQRAAEAITQQVTEDNAPSSPPSDAGRKRRDAAGSGSGESGGSGGSSPDSGPRSRPDRGGGLPAVPPITGGSTVQTADPVQTTKHADAASPTLMSQPQPVRVAESERRVSSTPNSVSRPMDVPVMRDTRRTPEIIEKRPGSQSADALRRAVSELSAASRIDVPVIKEPLLSEVDAPEQEISRGGKKSKRSARDLAKAAEERQIIIQQLMMGVLEKSKREKLLRLLIELGISEVEYRDLVAKLGEMEARHAAEQANEEATKQAIEIPVESPRNTDTRATEVPAMKVGAPKVNPTAVVPVTAETRAEMYARLKRMK
jgi:hypothetical protein